MGLTCCRIQPGSLDTTSCRAFYIHRTAYIAGRKDSPVHFRKSEPGFIGGDGKIAGNYRQKRSVADPLLIYSKPLLSKLAISDQTS